MYLLDVTCICNSIHSNGMCDANNLCQCFDGWTGDQCDEGMGQLHKSIITGYC